MATRQGVDKIDDSQRRSPSTTNQKTLINQILKDFPAARELFEYKDLMENPTVENATEFITQALDQNLDRIAKRENYVDYIAKRPRAERVGDHGLFTDDGVPLVLSNTAKEVAAHKGNVWLPIISLHREDAQRLGYDSGQAWRELLRSQADEIARCFKIRRENFRWYASFHNESHHPHVHMICYSTNPNEGFLTVHGIEAMKSGLAKQIFRQDLLEIYAEQTERRDELTKSSEDAMRELCAQIGSGSVPEKAGKLIMELSERLRHTKGKKVYGYLPPEMRKLVDGIVDELAQDPALSKMYDLWYEKRFDVLRTYTDKLPDKIPLSKQKEFKPIRNMVIREVLELGRGMSVQAPENDSIPDYGDLQPSENLPFTMDAFSDGDYDIPQSEINAEPIPHSHHGKPHIQWNDNYKLARKILYGKESSPDFNRAFSLFLTEAENGNALAMQDLGRMCADGLGRDTDTDLAQKWYAKALSAFLKVEASDERRRTYAQYRIGKMYAAGLGTEQNDRLAAEWFVKAAAANHKYAKYSLGGLYLRGQGVSQDFSEALRLFTLSANQGNAYASYECAKLFRDGLGTEQDDEKAQQRFGEAFIRFQTMEAESSDDRLQYRLGQMLRDGVGTDKNIPAALIYLNNSAKRGNVYAMYALANLYLDTGEQENIEKAIHWLTRSADGGNAQAQYALGKLYLTGENMEKDTAKALELLTASSDQSNQFAQYALGKLYLAGDYVEKDIAKALQFLTASSDQGNQFAQYAMGKLYLTGEGVEKDIAKALQFLTASSDQGNPFAQYAMGKLYLAGEDVEKDIAKALKFLTASSDQGNQFAQYALGKLYFMGQEVEPDKEKAIKYFTLSAEQGNEYAAFFLEHIPVWEREAVMNAAARLTKNLARMMEEDYRNRFAPHQRSDRKLLQRLARKKEALGIKVSH